MAVELPYFKYYPGEWIKGDITLCSMAAQGLFINICAYYWAKECSMCLANAKQRFSMEKEFAELIENNVLRIENDDIRIPFLDKQFSQFSEISEKRTEAGRKGGLMRRTKMPEKSTKEANAKQKLSYIEKRREEKIREDKKNIIKKVSLNISQSKACMMKNSNLSMNDVIEDFSKRSDLKSADPEYYFNVVLDWSDSKGMERRDWMAQIRNFARGDIKDNKLKTLNNVKQQSTLHGSHKLKGTNRIEHKKFDYEE